MSEQVDVNLHQLQLDLTDEAADVDHVSDYSISEEMLTQLIIHYGQEWKIKR